jgi:hypothetical protein
MKAYKHCLLALCFYSSLITISYSKEPKTFIHPFGELRVYYRDWLVVCEDKGNGICRMVATKLNNKAEPFFGYTRLTLYPPSQFPRKSNNPDYTNQTFIDFFKRDLPPLQGAVTINIDGKQLLQLQPHHTIFDSQSNQQQHKVTALETYWFEADNASLLMAKMNTGKQLSIHYLTNNIPQQESFSLAGFNKALAFIQKR